MRKGIETMIYFSLVQHFVKLLFVVMGIFLLCGCISSNKYERDAWIVAKSSQANQKELVEFLNYYKQAGSREKYEAACFLIKNISSKFGVQGNGLRLYDKDIIKSDSLKASLEYSFLQKERSPFLKKYSLEQFFEYILPYRVCSELLEYYWKWDIPKHFKVKSSDIIEAAKNIDSQINIDISSESYGDIPQSYTSLIKECKFDFLTHENVNKYDFKIK